MKNQAQCDAFALTWDRTLQGRERDCRHDFLPSLGKGLEVAKREAPHEQYYLPQKWAFHCWDWAYGIGSSPLLAQQLQSREDGG